MSVSVTCSGCAATFKVKDEYAGKPRKCPKCNGPVVVPSEFHGGDTIRMPPMARPNPKPKPDEDEDEMV